MYEIGDIVYYVSNDDMITRSPIREITYICTKAGYINTLYTVGILNPTCLKKEELFLNRDDAHDAYRNLLKHKEENNLNSSYYT